MAVATRSGVPCFLTAGDTISFTFGDAGYLPAEWHLDWILSRDGLPVGKVRATAASNARDFLVTVLPVDSRKFTPGRCNWYHVLTAASDATQRVTYESGALTILPDPTQALKPSPNQLALVACNAAIAELASDPNSSVSFGGHSYTRASMGELWKARDRLQVEVYNELRALGLTNKGGARTIVTRFR